MSELSILEAALKRDRAIVVGGILLVMAISWAYILAGAGMGMSAVEMSSLTLPRSAPASDMDMGMDGGGMAVMTQPAAWTTGYAMLMFFMWWVMMIAMMIPSASPMLLLFASVNRKQRAQGSTAVSTSIFGAGYLIAWGGFSMAAVALQWGLERLGILSAMMASTQLLFAGLVLLAAGAYQFTPLKHACLSHCRSPIAFVSHHWRPGAAGALRMGLEHGVFCLGCCWPLMALLFVGGVMNLYWIASIAVYILLEKVLPAGHKLGKLAGAGLMLWGAGLLATML